MGRDIKTEFNCTYRDMERGWAMSDDEEDDFAQLHARADDMDTSKMAARKAEPTALRHKGIILRSLETHGPMTSEEIAKMTGLSLWQCGRRVPDLRAEGFVVDTGFRRKNDSGRDAAVWGLAKEQSELQFDPPPKKRSRKSLEDEIERLREELDAWKAMLSDVVREQVQPGELVRNRDELLASWLRSNEAMEWLDDDSPLVRQTREVLDE